MAALTDTRQEFNSLFTLYVVIACVVAVLVFGAVFFALLRYRRREGRIPSQRSQHNLAEGAWITAIVVVVAVILTATLTTESKVDATSPGALHVRVTAFQWGWSFDYTDRGVTVIGDSNHEPVLGVPAGREISFAITSRDVIHSFWIPSERFKRDAFPDRVNRFDLVFDQPGGHEGVCAEFCGLRHSNMRFRVLVLGESDFQRWLEVQRQRAAGTGRAAA